MYLIDWITMSQQHIDLTNPNAKKLPIVDGSIVSKKNRISLDSNEYETEWESRPAYRIRGSHETSISIKSDGYRVTIDGNIGRFNRLDNVFGFHLEAIIKKCNDFVKSVGLPPFSEGFIKIDKLAKYSDDLFVDMGAVITRLDVTRNYLTGSESNAQLFIDHLATLSISHVKQGRFGSSTVYWGGRGSKKNIKAYIKYLEMSANTKSKKLREEIEKSKIYKYCKKEGLVRIEYSIHRNTLKERGMRRLRDIDMSKVINLFNERTEEILKTKKLDIQNLDLEDFPARLRTTIAAYWQGLDLKQLMSRATYFRHAKELRNSFGIDISIPHAVSRDINPRVINLNIVPASKLPSFYSLDEKPLLRVL